MPHCHCRPAPAPSPRDEPLPGPHAAGRSPPPRRSLLRLACRPHTRLALAISEWLTGLSRRRTTIVPVRKVVADLTAILETIPLPQWPVCGPFGPTQDGLRPPGRAEYLGSGIVRLDKDALTVLAGLADGEDFKATLTSAGPVLTVGKDTYLARQEEPAPKPPGTLPP